MNKHRQQMIDRFSPILQQAERLLPKGRADIRFVDYDHGVAMDLKLGDAARTMLLRQITSDRESVWDIWEDLSLPEIQRGLEQAVEELKREVKQNEGGRRIVLYPENFADGPAQKISTPNGSFVVCRPHCGLSMVAEEYARLANGVSGRPDGSPHTLALARAAARLALDIDASLGAEAMAATGRRKTMNRREQYESWAKEKGLTPYGKDADHWLLVPFGWEAWQARADLAAEEKRELMNNLEGLAARWAVSGYDMKDDCAEELREALAKIDKENDDNE